MFSYFLLLPLLVVIVVWGFSLNDARLRDESWFAGLEPGEEQRDSVEIRGRLGITRMVLTNKRLVEQRLRWALVRGGAGAGGGAARQRGDPRPPRHHADGAHEQASRRATARLALRAARAARGRAGRRAGRLVDRVGQHRPAAPRGDAVRRAQSAGAAADALRAADAGRRGAVPHQLHAPAVDAALGQRHQPRRARAAGELLLARTVGGGAVPLPGGAAARAPAGAEARRAGAGVRL